MLVDATRVVLANGLFLLGVSAPLSGCESCPPPTRPAGRTPNASCVAVVAA